MSLRAEVQPAARVALAQTGGATHPLADSIVVSLQCEAVQQTRLEQQEQRMYDEG